MQGSAPAHKAKATQTWLAPNVLDFIRTYDWTFASPDFNPLDYTLWDQLQEMACSKSHYSVESLKASLRKAEKESPLEKIRTVIAWRPEHLKVCTQSGGGHFEWTKNENVLHCFFLKNIFSFSFCDFLLLSFGRWKYRQYLWPYSVNNFS